MRLTENIYMIQLGINNLYLITDKGETALIDAYVADQQEEVFAAICQEGIDPQTLTKVIITHAHHDHMGACAFFKKYTPAKFAAHIEDAGMVENVWLQFLETWCRFLGPTKDQYAAFLDTAGRNAIKIDILLRDSDIIPVGDLELQVIYAPGHSPGNICIYEPEQKALFTGDTVQGAEKFLPDWLGLMVDAVSYWKSINRIAQMDVELFLPGHHDIRTGKEAKKDIYSSIKRFRDIEEGILEIVTSHHGLTLVEIKDLIVEKILGARREDDTDTELYSVNAYLQKLCFEGKVCQQKGMIWTRA